MILGTILLWLLRPATAAEAEFPVSIRVDASETKGELRPIWRFFGYDEPNFTYMRDGKKLLSELAQLGPQTVYVRTHHLLTSGDGTPALKWGSTGAYAEDAKGNSRYDWAILDRIFDTYIERGLKPYAQIGFMPRDLSTRPDLYPQSLPPGQRVRVDGGQAYPPKDYAKWEELVCQWVRHCVEKYGRAEVEQWYWEVWNEPNINYWRGTPAEYDKLYDYAINGVRRALPTARVGGPEVAGPDTKFLKRFLEHCLRGTNYATGKIGAPLDFIAFHAKGAPRVVDNHVQMGIATHLRNINAGFQTIAGFPELKGKPIVIGESDPEGCAACPASEFPQNAYRNGALYASYTAASFARKYDLAERYNAHFEGALTWAFEFENQPLFAGFRALASGGLDLPVLNTFRMFGRMSGRRLKVQSSADAGVEAIQARGVRETPDVSALASLQGRKVCVIVWHYHDDYVPGPAAAVELKLTGLALTDGDAQARHYRIDNEHSNAYEAWKRMGSPASPTAEQYKALEQAGQLAEFAPPEIVQVTRGAATLRFSLPRQSVSLLEITLP